MYGKSQTRMITITLIAAKSFVLFSPIKLLICKRINGSIRADPLCIMQRLKMIENYLETPNVNPSAKVS